MNRVLLLLVCTQLVLHCEAQSNPSSSYEAAKYYTFGMLIISLIYFIVLLVVMLSPKKKVLQLDDAEGGSCTCVCASLQSADNAVNVKRAVMATLTVASVLAVVALAVNEYSQISAGSTTAYVGAWNRHASDFTANTDCSGLSGDLAILCNTALAAGVLSFLLTIVGGAACLVGLYKAFRSPRDTLPHAVAQSSRLAMACFLAAVLAWWSGGEISVKIGAGSSAQLSATWGMLVICTVLALSATVMASMARLEQENAEGGEFPPMAQQGKAIQMLQLAPPQYPPAQVQVQAPGQLQIGAQQEVMQAISARPGAVTQPFQFYMFTQQGQQLGVQVTPM